jgi:hypothetical protein
MLPPAKHRPISEVLVVKRGKFMSGRSVSIVGTLATVFLLRFCALGQGDATGAIGGAVRDSNMWKHPVFDKPSITDIENPSFGQITNTVGTPRLMQFSLRYGF